MGSALSAGVLTRTLALRVCSMGLSAGGGRQSPSWASFFLIAVTAGVRHRRRVRPRPLMSVCVRVRSETLGAPRIPIWMWGRGRKKQPSVGVTYLHLLDVLD